ncbi:MAG: c-type cytochrome [candidate division NC10 bacterium]|nr:c-type cytochrome [candidate division NC10 bacterium]
MSVRGPLAAILLVGAAAAVAGPTAAELRGEAERGRALFTRKECARCHKPRGERGLGPPLEELRRRQGILELAGRLWNHAPAMLGVFEHEKLEWPRLGTPEMADLVAYLQADPARDPAPNLPRGQVLLVQRGCLKCHRLRGEGGAVGIEFTEYPGGYESPVVWAASIWNHSPRMAGQAAQIGVLYPRFTGEEMADLFGFLRSVAAPSR